MSDLTKDTGYLRATLREALLDLNCRPTVPKIAAEILRDSHVLEAVLLLIDRVAELEKKVEALEEK